MSECKNCGHPEADCFCWYKQIDWKKTETIDWGYKGPIFTTKAYQYFLEILEALDEDVVKVTWGDVLVDSSDIFMQMKKNDRDEIGSIHYVITESAFYLIKGGSSKRIMGLRDDDLTEESEDKNLKELFRFENSPKPTEEENSRPIAKKAMKHYQDRFDVERRESFPELIVNGPDDLEFKYD